MCGASSAQNQIEAAQQQFYSQLTSEYGTIFGESQQILGALTKSFEPILEKGISQEGFSAAEKTNLESQATTGTGQNYAKASEALAKAQGAEGGGRDFVPTGAKEEQQRQIATSAAQQESGLESGITAADYATGRQNYLEAAGILGGVAGQYNPTGVANAATGAGSAASTTANEISQANNSWMGLVSGAIGAAGSAAGAYFGAGAKG